MSDEEARGEHFVRGPWGAGVFDGLHQHLGGGAAEFFAGPIYRGEERVRVVRTFDISGADDGHILRDAQAGIAAGVDGAESHGIVGREDSGGAGIEL